MKKRIIFLILIFLNLATIFFFSHQTAEQSKILSNSLSKQLEIHTPNYETKTQPEKNIFHANMQSYVRRIAHMILFFSLGVLMFLWLATYPARWYRTAGGLIFGVLCAFGDEIHQLFVPGRTFELADILYDVFGYLIGIGITALIFMIVKKHQKRAEND